MERNLRKERIGIVTSQKMDKSITVLVERREKHAMYGKFLKKSNKFLAHDENNECKEGDIVRILLKLDLLVKEKDGDWQKSLKEQNNIFRKWYNKNQD